MLVDALIIMTVFILKTLLELRKPASFGKFSKERPWLQPYKSYHFILFCTILRSDPILALSRPRYTHFQFCVFVPASVLQQSHLWVLTLLRLPNIVWCWRQVNVQRSAASVWGSWLRVSCWCHDALAERCRCSGLIWCCLAACGALPRPGCGGGWLDAVAAWWKWVMM